jgi:hypothetical protein
VARGTRLKNLADVRNELARIYRAIKRGAIPLDHGRLLVYALAQLSSVMERSDLEARVAALEKIPNPDTNTDTE